MYWGSTDLGSSLLTAKEVSPTYTGASQTFGIH
jgi:hypothetical protein